jgi:putative lipoic acid-binding regulatory protein
MTQEPFGDEELQFPLDCQFRVIAENREGMHFVIETVLLELGVTSPLHTENQSETGRYQSFRVDIRVNSKEHMNKIDAALRNIVGVRMVL